MRRYFIQDEYAGLSAFENAPASEAERNASFAAVVVLVPLDGSRLGKVWVHAEKIQEIASLVREDILQGGNLRDESLIEDVDEPIGKATHALEEYWDKFKIKEKEKAVSPDTPSKSPLNPRQSPYESRKRRSRGLTISKDPSAQSAHPAKSIHEFLDAFGPLVFPLYRAALLRKRILLISYPPMQTICNFVYLLSVFSAIPNSISEALPESPGLLKPLFAVGVYDIAHLETLAKSRPKQTNDSEDQYTPVESGWIACTSDTLLSTKTSLYDIKVEFPKTSSAPLTDDRLWPSITDSNSAPILATQRDLRRYKTLSAGLAAFSHSDLSDSTPHDAEAEAETTALLTNSATTKPPPTIDMAIALPNENSITEPTSWAAIAYGSFVWWASAGEPSAALTEETQHDHALLDAALDGNMRPESPAMRRHSQPFADRALSQEAYEMAVVTYFHRLTDGLFSGVMDSLLAGLEEEEEEGGTGTNEGKSVVVSKEDLERIGLDVWSQADRRFVRELCEGYLGVGAEVQGASVECCGVRFI